MATEIEEIVETDSPPSSVHPHNHNSMKNDNYCSNSNSDDSNGNIEINGEINGNINGERKQDSKRDGTKGTSTRVLCWRALTTRKSESNSSKKKDKKIDTKSEQKGKYSSSPLKQELDALLPDNFSQQQFQQSSSFMDFCSRYEKLDSPQKRCLSSFVLFPEDKAVKRSLLVYLWTKEGFLDLATRKKTHEDSATEILNDLKANKLIIPVSKNSHKVASSFKMQPDKHSTMILIGKSQDSRPDENSFSWLDDWVCLKKSKPIELEHPEKVKTLFNVNEGFIDFKLETFSKMKKVELLYLGRWQSWDEHHHIDVTNSEFLKGLKNMEKLRFLSLQGISGIQELPSSISNLTSLEILDLRACYNLEKLPKEIGSLKQLTHLDISECYLLDCMPKQLLSLQELQVLKGFVITDTKNKNFCTLSELAGLKKLRKLSINLNSVTFSEDKLSAVFKLKELLKLKITWGGKVSKVKQNKKYKQENDEAKSKATKLENIKSLKRLGSAVGEVMSKAPNLGNKGLRRLESAVGEVRSSGSKLEKLELQCLPNRTLPRWVIPENLTSLKKLYIRGGELRSLGRVDQEGNQKWNHVKALRFKYLKEFKVDWTELMAMFPELQYLEKFRCPKVTLVPCDCYGVWVKHSKKEPAAQPQTTS